LSAESKLVNVNPRATPNEEWRTHLDQGGTTMLKSRTMAVAGTIAALSLAAAPIAAASTDGHSGKPSPDRIQRVEKKSPDKRSPDRNSRDHNRTRDSRNHH
jgi:hypothetical protein